MSPPDRSRLCGSGFLRPGPHLGDIFQVKSINPAYRLPERPRASSIEEAQILVRRCAEPRPSGESVKGSIRRVSWLVALPFSRTRSLWYGEARRVNAEEMDRLRRAAEKAECSVAVTGIEHARRALLSSHSSTVREIIDGLTEMLLAIRADAGGPLDGGSTDPEDVSHFGHPRLSLPYG